MVDLTRRPFGIGSDEHCVRDSVLILPLRDDRVAGVVVSHPEEAAAARGRRCVVVALTVHGHQRGRCRPVRMGRCRNQCHDCMRAPIARRFIAAPPACAGANVDVQKRAARSSNPSAMTATMTAAVAATRDNAMQSKHGMPSVTICVVDSAAALMAGLQRKGAANGSRAEIRRIPCRTTCTARPGGVRSHALTACSQSLQIDLLRCATRQGPGGGSFGECRAWRGRATTKGARGRGVGRRFAPERPRRNGRGRCCCPYLAVLITTAPYTRWP